MFTIGLGSQKGATIPHIVNGQRRGVKKDKNGSTIITRLNKQALVAIAKAGGGTFVRGSNQSLGLNSMLANISEIEKTEYDSKEYTSYTSRYQLFLALGLGFILLELFIFKRKGKWFKGN